ncbi:hypothetical protein HK100_011539 [Physocladia obscura]|uniref:Uncharacterized protein n=1 Tax=Physocladia obscura TaxID=109957 RepID=A0AAD5T146_9FUNG|nr:hypothetical protein HK100_011539 [Physocladia obscura]
MMQFGGKAKVKALSEQTFGSSMMEGTATVTTESFLSEFESDAETEFEPSSSASTNTPNPKLNSKPSMKTKPKLNIAAVLASMFRIGFSGSLSKNSRAPSETSVPSSLDSHTHTLTRSHTHTPATANLNKSAHLYSGNRATSTSFLLAEQRQTQNECQELSEPKKKNIGTSLKRFLSTTSRKPKNSAKTQQQQHALDSSSTLPPKPLVSLLHRSSSFSVQSSIILPPIIPRSESVASMASTYSNMTTETNVNSSIVNRPKPPPGPPPQHLKRSLSKSQQKRQVHDTLMSLNSEPLPKASMPSTVSENELENEQVECKNDNVQNGKGGETEEEEEEEDDDDDDSNITSSNFSSSLVADSSNNTTENSSVSPSPKLSSIKSNMGKTRKVVNRVSFALPDDDSENVDLSRDLARQSWLIADDAIVHEADTIRKQKKRETDLGTLLEDNMPLLFHRENMKRNSANFSMSPKLVTGRNRSIDSHGALKRSKSDNTLIGDGKNIADMMQNMMVDEQILADTLLEQKKKINRKKLGIKARYSVDFSHERQESPPIQGNLQPLFLIDPHYGGNQKQLQQQFYKQQIEQHQLQHPNRHSISGPLVQNGIYFPAIQQQQQLYPVTFPHHFQHPHQQQYFQVCQIPNNSQNSILSSNQHRRNSDGTKDLSRYSGDRLSAEETPKSTMSSTSTSTASTMPFSLSPQPPPPLLPLTMSMMAGVNGPLPVNSLHFGNAPYPHSSQIYAQSAMQMCAIATGTGLGVTYYAHQQQQQQFMAADGGHQYAGAGHWQYYSPQPQSLQKQQEQHIKLSDSSPDVSENASDEKTKTRKKKFGDKSAKRKSIALPVDAEE